MLFKKIIFKFSSLFHQNYYLYFYNTLFIKIFKFLIFQSFFIIKKYQFLNSINDKEF